MARRENGFTIIETTLVLAITGLIVAVILVGIGNSLNHQRYMDATNQAVDFFRGQYTNTANALNDRPDNETCGSSGITTVVEKQTIGASECLLLGKIARSSDGKTITTYQVIATRDLVADSTTIDLSDADLLIAANPRQGINTIDTYQPEWDTRLLRPGSADGAQFTMMVVRTPVTGTVRTYVSNSDTITIASLLAAPQTDLRVCIDQDGFFGVGAKPMGIMVAKDAINTTGVQVIPAGDCV